MQRERKYIARVVINNIKCIKHYFKVSKLLFFAGGSWVLWKLINNYIIWISNINNNNQIKTLTKINICLPEVM